MAHKIAASSFRLLGLGGGIEQSYYFPKKSDSVIPKELEEKCEDDICYTKRLNVILSLAGVIYISDNYLNSNNTVISINKKDMNLIKTPMKK